MVDKEKLRYDLAMQAATVMTLREGNNSTGIPTGVMLINFLAAYRQYSEKFLDEKLNEIVDELAKSE